MGQIEKSSLNLYAALGVRGNAPMGEICRAYQQYAPLCHPDATDYDPNVMPIKGLTQQQYWLLINEACEVLTNAEWRARYNIGSLKQQYPAYEFSGECLDIYHKFIVYPRTLVVLPSDGNNQQPKMVTMEPKLLVSSIVYFLDLELEEMFAGTFKTIQYARMLNVQGRAQTIVQTLDVTIAPYMRDGGRFTMKGYGHEIDQIRGDFVLVLRQIPHPVYSTAGDDIICNATVPLSTALFGGHLRIETIDSKHLLINIEPPFPTAHPLVRRFDGEGLKTLTGRGALIVNIYLTLPCVPLHMRSEAERIIRAMEQFMVMGDN